MNSPIFIISGVPGSGKTTLSGTLLKRFPFGVHIPVDDVRALVVSGISHPVPKWTDETARQFALARSAAADVARRYVQAGFAVAIDDVILHEPAIHDLMSALAGLNVHRIILQPPVETALARNRQRRSKSFDPSILEDTIHMLYGASTQIDFASSGWLVVDNDAQSVDETADEILRRIGLVSQK
jgi:predicted kinase